MNHYIFAFGFIYQTFATGVHHHHHHHHHSHSITGCVHLPFQRTNPATRSTLELHHAVSTIDNSSSSGGGRRMCTAGAPNV